jgi:hypothetical protein
MKIRRQGRNGLPFERGELTINVHKPYDVIILTVHWFSQLQLRYRLVNETHSEWQTMSAACRRARPTKASPSRAHTVTMTRGLRSEHVCTAPYTFPRTTHVEPRIACGPDKSSGNGLSSPGGYSTPSSTAKNVKPTSTSGFDSCGN